MKVKGLNGKSFYLKVSPIDWLGKSASKFQFECKTVLAGFWKGDMVGEEVNMPGTKQRFDFVNVTKMIILECQGSQHDCFNKFFHNNNIFNFAKAQQKDDKKRKFAELNKFTLFEVRSVEELHRVMVEIN